MTTSTRALVKTEILSRQMRRQLAGHGPDVQGAVLADLVSVFIVGHHPALRDESFAQFVNLARDLIPATEKEIFPNGLPPEWSESLVSVSELLESIKI